MVEELNMAEKYWIEQHKNEKAEKLAEDLKRPKALAQIEFELQLIKQRDFEQERVTQEELKNPRLPMKESEVIQCVKDDSPLLKSFVRRKEGGICAMSSSAAQLSDELTKSDGKKSLADIRPDCVTKVRK